MCVKNLGERIYCQLFRCRIPGTFHGLGTYRLDAPRTSIEERGVAEATRGMKPALRAAGN